MQKCLPMLAPEDRMRRPRRTDHDVRLAGCLVELLKRNHAPLKLLGHPPRPILGPVAYQDRPSSLLHQVPRCQLTHLARAHQENSPPL